LLTEAGLRLPSQQTVIIEVPGRPVTLYIAQEKLPAARFAHQLIHEFESDLIPPVVELINRRLASDQVPVTIDAVNKYYREDKLIWTLFLLFRRIDRWLTTQILRRRYEFILPGNIKR
jgi:hypothetical protein